MTSWWRGEPAHARVGTEAPEVPGRHSSRARLLLRGCAGFRRTRTRAGRRRARSRARGRSASRWRATRRWAWRVRLERRLRDLVLHRRELLDERGDVLEVVVFELRPHRLHEQHRTL